MKAGISMGEFVAGLHRMAMSCRCVLAPINPWMQESVSMKLRNAGMQVRAWEDCA